jgi:hypothetical protein
MRDRSRETQTPTDGGHERVPVSDWATLEDHLRRFAGRGSVEASDGRIAVSVGSARFAVPRAGSVETGMSLHSFEQEGVEALYFDHEAGHVQVRGGDGLVYEFRRP